MLIVLFHTVFYQKIKPINLYDVVVESGRNDQVIIQLRVLRLLPNSIAYLLILINKK